MVDAQQLSSKSPAAVLADVAVAGHHVAAVEMKFLFWQPIITKQADHPGNLNLKVYRPDPIVFRQFLFGAQFTHLPPGVERIGSEFTVVEVDYFGHFTAEESERASHVHHVDGHVESIENQNAASQRAAGGERWGTSRNDATTSRTMCPRTMRNGCLKTLHERIPYCKPIEIAHVGWAMLALLTLHFRIFIVVDFSSARQGFTPSEHLQRL